MAPAREVSFELERFEWMADDRLEVQGRWNGLRSTRTRRPALTVDAGGRRHHVSGTLVSEEPWLAGFQWAGGRGEILGAELEMGRSLVVELPPPRRRRRRSAGAAAEGDLRAQVEELRAMVADLRAERAAAPSAEEAERLAEAAERHQREAAELRAEVASLREAEDAGGAEAVEAARAERDEALAELERLRAGAADSDELAGLRLAHGSLRAAHEQLEDEVEALRGVREERDALAAELERARAGTDDRERSRAELGELIRELQDRAAAAEGEQERLERELAAAHEEIARLNREREEAERRIETERATTTEVHARLATAREETDRTIAAEALETERLRTELADDREEAERRLAAERAEVARLREELITRAEDADAGEAGEASRRMLERISRDLDRERGKSKLLQRELDALRSESAEARRVASSATANGTLALDEPPAATAAGRSGRGVATPEGTRRRVDAARNAAAHRVPRARPSAVSLWAVRLAAALVVAVLGIALVILVSWVT